MKTVPRCAAGIAAVLLLPLVHAADAVPDWEGALGLIGSYAPTYAGAQDYRSKLVPGFFLRWGRLSVTNASGFVTRRSDDVVRGLGLDIKADDRLRVNLSLRFDAGRSDSDSAALSGLGNVKATVRVRLSGTLRLDDGWRAGAGWSVDTFGRGGGSVTDASIVRDLRWSPGTTWSLGASGSLASQRYMRTYFGVSAEQAERTGYPVYAPGTGLRDAALFANARTEFGRDWVALSGVSIFRLLGPAAGSPLTKKPAGWSVSAGLARRF